MNKHRVYWSVVGVVCLMLVGYLVSAPGMFGQVTPTKAIVAAVMVLIFFAVSVWAKYLAD